ncbi:MAG TPA: hypothetical protein VNM14_20245 [Planctomycetota bacterium]|nr:hypothetical protein [Planctomycetota bacterium]
MARTCINHKDAAAATMCHQCHHPICTACSLVTPQGTYCSPECSILNRQVKEQLSQGKKDGMKKLEGLIKVVAAFLLLGLGFWGIHVAAQKVPKLKKADVIGRLLDAFGAGERAPR